MHENPIHIIDKMIDEFRVSLNKFTEAEILYSRDIQDDSMELAKYKYFKYIHESGNYEKYLDYLEYMIESTILMGVEPWMAESLIGIDLDVEILNAFEKSWGLVSR